MNRFTQALTLVATFSTAIMPSITQAIEVEQRPLTTVPALPRAPATPSASINPSPAPISLPKTPSNPAWDLFQQIDGLNKQVARLQGQLEEQQMLIERLQSDLRIRYEDLDQRLETLNMRTGTTSTAPKLTTNTTPSPSEFRNTVNHNATPEQIEAQKEAYLAAYQEFQNNGAMAAITAMNNFLRTNPDSIFSASAHYWLGEFKLALKPADLDAAEKHFLNVIHDFDGDSKVPAAYYKMATISELRKNMADALRWMNDLVKRFPDSDEARLAASFITQNTSATVAP